MFDQIKNMASMLGKAKQFKERLEQVQAELAHRTVEADAGGGAVRVVANGQLEIVSTYIDPAALTALITTDMDTDQHMVQDLITDAANDALSRAREMVQQEMAQLSSELDLDGLPGLDRLLQQ